ncbi:MAG TPA: SDR family oxidoreductase [Bacteroidales bacterium]|nr:SDR family oxidoreductase [Bacteroidales bacterium]
MTNKKNLLITGPLGHIGSKFIHSLCEQNNFDKVILIDNLSTLRYSSLFNLPSNNKFKFIEADILKYDFENILNEVDIVLHLAAITDAAGSFDMADKIMETNLYGTNRVAGACAITNTKLIFISTTSVYGPKNEFVDEDCSEDELNPQSPYAKSKLLAERSLFELSEKYQDFKFTICRFGTIFGTSVGMRFHTAINKFIWQAVMDVPVTVWTTALNQRRPYLALDDAIRALHFIVSNDYFNNTVYNVLSINVTVNEIIEEIKKYVPDLGINFVDSKIMNQLSYTVSNEKFKKLGFEFKYTISDIFDTIMILRNANFEKNCERDLM